MRIFSRNRRRGQALVEMAFMMPWIVFLFVGVLDSGFYTYAAIATQNAARAVAIQSANSGGTMSAAAMCVAVQNELRFLPNVALVGTCAGTQGAVSNAAPIWVCAGILTSASTSSCGLTVPNPPGCADCAGSGATGTNPRSIQAVVTYRSIPLVPIPGILPMQLQLTRIAESRVIE